MPRLPSEEPLDVQAPYVCEDCGGESWNETDAMYHECPPDEEEED